MSEIKHLLPDVKQYFKANLHTHSTVSDGKFTPEEVKALYKERGYQIVAFTDHEVCIAHPELEDESFLPLTSYELAVNAPLQNLPKPYKLCYHLCFIAKDKENRWQSFDPKYCWGNIKQYIDQVVSDGCEERHYSTEFVNKLIADANAKGFLVTYNHPDWSQQSYPDYIGLKGLWAMEIYNHECCCLGYDDNNSKVYQDLLRQGNRLFPVATDDFHQLTYPGRIAGGWVMVGAQELRYDSVIAALEKGDFYASTGPEIHSLTLEGTVLKLTCSPAAEIRVQAHHRLAARRLPEADQPLCQAEVDIASWLDTWKQTGDTDAFLRVTVTDAAGHKAYTRAYRIDELV